MNPHTYQKICDFKNGYAKVMQNHRWGLIDKSGDLVVPCQYDKIKQLASGMIKVKKDGNWGLLDHRARQLIPCEYHIRQISETLFLVKKDSKCGLYSQNGTVVLPCEYDWIDRSWGSKRCGLSPAAWMRVKKDGLYGIVNTEGALIVPVLYKTITIYRTAKTPEGIRNRFDLAGNVIDHCGFVHYVRRGHRIDCCFGVQKDGKWGVFHDYISQLAEYPWDNIKHCGTEICVNQNGKWGIIDIHGRLLLECQWEDEESACREYERKCHISAMSFYKNV